MKKEILHIINILSLCSLLSCSYNRINYVYDHQFEGLISRPYIFYSNKYPLSVEELCYAQFKIDSLFEIDNFTKCDSVPEENMFLEKYPSFDDYKAYLYDGYKKAICMKKTGNPEYWEDGFYLTMEYLLKKKSKIRFEENDSLIIMHDKLQKKTYANYKIDYVLRYILNHGTHPIPKPPYGLINYLVNSGLELGIYDNDSVQRWFPLNNLADTIFYDHKIGNGPNDEPIYHLVYTVDDKMNDIMQGIEDADVSKNKIPCLMRYNRIKEFSEPFYGKKIPKSISTNKDLISLLDSIIQQNEVIEYVQFKGFIYYDE